jgi:hypothetical protein
VDEAPAPTTPSLRNRSMSASENRSTLHNTNPLLAGSACASISHVTSPAESTLSDRERDRQRVRRQVLSGLVFSALLVAGTSSSATSERSVQPDGVIGYYSRVKARKPALGVLLLCLAGCDIVTDTTLVPATEWKLGPVEPGGVLNLPGDPCTGPGELVRRAFVSSDSTPRIDPRQTPIVRRHSEAVLRLDIPANLPEGDYAFFVECYTRGVASTYEEFRFDVEVTTDR